MKKLLLFLMSLMLVMTGCTKSDNTITFSDAKKMLDKIIIKEDRNTRGREKGEIAKVISEGVSEQNSNMDFKVILDEVKALERAYVESTPGDMIIVFFEELEPLVEFIKSKIQKCKGNLSEASIMLNISKRQLNNKILEYNLRDWINSLKKDNV